MMYTLFSFDWNHIKVVFKKCRRITKLLSLLGTNEWIYFQLDFRSYQNKQKINGVSSSPFDWCQVKSFQANFQICPTTSKWKKLFLSSGFYECLWRTLYVFASSCNLKNQTTFWIIFMFEKKELFLHLWMCTQLNDNKTEIHALQL